MFQHDCCPGWKANVTHDLLQHNSCTCDRFIPARREQTVPRWPGSYFNHKLAHVPFETL